MGWRFVLSLLFAFVVAVFAILNASDVHINFLVWQGDISQALVIIISAIFGAVIVLLLGFIKQIQLKMAVKTERKAVGALQEENKILLAKLELVNEQLTYMAEVQFQNQPEAAEEAPSQE